MHIRNTQKTQQSHKGRRPDAMTDAEMEGAARAEFEANRLDEIEAEYLADREAEQEEERQGREQANSSPARPTVKKADIKAALKERRRNRPGLKQAQTSAGDASQEEEVEESQRGSALPPPPVPPRVWSAPVQRLLDETCEAFGVPPQIPVACLFALSSGCIGRTRSIRVKQDWFEPANLFIALVGTSGIGKSPVIRRYFKTVYHIERILAEQWEKENKAYIKEWEEWNKRPKAEKKGQEPPTPVGDRKEYIVDDATIESIGYILKRNQRGLQWLVDELSGMIGSMDRYNKGRGETTRSRLLTLYDCGPWKNSRKDASNDCFIPHACASIFGGIQPEMVTKVFTEEDRLSGFLPRFLFIAAEQDRPDFFSEAALSDASSQVLENISTGLIAYEFDAVQGKDGGSYDAPRTLRLSTEAKAAYVRWHDNLVNETWGGGMPGVSTNSWAKKLKAHCLRICLNLHCLEAAAEGREADTVVSRDEMDRACRLADWVHEMQENFLLMLSGGMRRLSVLERTVAKVLVEEADKQGDIPVVVVHTSTLTKMVNASLLGQGLPELDSRKVGLLTTGLGVRNRVKVGPRGAQEWARKLTSDEIKKLRSLLEARPTRPTRVTSK